MSIYIPTWLYIKEHSITGLRYFGKTTKDPLKYSGSGKHWLSHIRKHGKEHIITIWSCLFESKEDLIEFATFFSEEFDIVKSNKWANLCIENGTDGGARPNNHFIKYNKLPKPKSVGLAISKARKGVSNFSKPIIINGVKYPSMVSAAKALGVVEQTIYYYIKTGKAILA